MEMTRYGQYGKPLRGFPHCPHRLDNLRRLSTFPKRRLLIRFTALKTKTEEKRILQKSIDISIMTKCRLKNGGV